MDIENIIITLFGVGGIGGMLLKYYLEKQNKKDDLELEALNDLKDEIKLLGDRIEQLTQEKLELSVKVAKLEERLLLSAKNRVKKHERTN
mgnify:FL=1|tara:strand:+ start:66 stop:335 length:270 start_codon:yes stop_codon:yes gene_type:complete